MTGECREFRQIDVDNGTGGGTLACWLAVDHDGPHWDEADNLYWHEGQPNVTGTEYTPDDGEAQRIADTYADAAAELARDEAGEA